MSTAGKVLVVLVLLVVPVWIVLASAVANLNTEWTQELAKQNKQIETLTEQVAQNKRDIQKLEENIGLVQTSAAEQQTALREKLTDVERARAESIQIQTGVALDLDRLKATIKNAEAVRDRRVAEKADEIKALASTRQDVERIKGENSELMGELSKLRDEFKATLEENRKLVERLLRARSQRTGSVRVAPTT